MDTTQQPGWLLTLEAQLQQIFQEQLPHGSAWQVRCGLRRGELMVLTQHPPRVQPDVAQVFRLLEQRLRIVQPEIGAEELLCRLGLKVVGQAQPYATRAVKLERIEPGTEAEAIAPLVSPDTLPSSSAIAPSPALPVDDWKAEERVEQGMEAEIGGEPEEQENSPPEPHPPEPHLPEPQTDSTLEPVDLLLQEGLQPAPAPSPWLAQLSKRLVASQTFATLPLSLLCLGLAVGGYLLTRPCVVGGCRPLTLAQEQSRVALQQIQQPESPQAVVKSYEQLMEASYRLSRIPSWSKYYSSAQELMAFYDAEAEILENVVLAQKQAYQAAVQSQNPPHPLPIWRAVQQNWQGAIAQLDRVPPSSPVYALAQTKKREYQTNLLTINAYIMTEQQAQERVRIARETAQLAEARGGTASSLAAWQQTNGTWQAALNLLRQVSRNTMAFGEAQQLLALYEPKGQMARDRTQQEQLASDRFLAALDLATQAQQSERGNQWTQAVTQWREALTRVQQVPSGTSRFNQAQPLINAYRAALNGAQQKLRVAVGLQTAQAGLRRTCAGVPALCTYASVGDAIQVRLTSGFTQAAQKALSGVPTGNMVNNNTAVLAYLNPFLQELAAIGEAADLPIELYNPDGSLFGTYEPRLDGFVPLRARELPRDELNR